MRQMKVAREALHQRVGVCNLCVSAPRLLRRATNNHTLSPLVLAFLKDSGELYEHSRYFKTVFGRRCAA